jgi:mannose-6-phosphate isomerase-like protein (cupin superfamily)
MLSAGEGLFIAAGKTATLKAEKEGPSTFLHFFLVPAADLDRPATTAPAAVKELYRTVAPIPDLKPGGYDLNLTRVTFPAQMPSNPLHHRSGAALYYIISGTGANTVDGKTETKGPGSLIYEPFGLVPNGGTPAMSRSHSWLSTSTQKASQPYFRAHQRRINNRDRACGQRFIRSSFVGLFELLSPWPRAAFCPLCQHGRLSRIL